MSAIEIPPPERQPPAAVTNDDAFRLLVESVRDYAIFIIDRDGYVSTWNRGAERLKGYRSDEIVGRHFSRFYVPADREAGRPARGLATAVAEGRYEDEGWRQRKDGTLFWADVVITALYDNAGTHIGFAKVTRDLTERREAQQQAIRLAHAEEAVRLREEFMAIAAHELRTPLNALQLQMSALDLLIDRPQADREQLADRMRRALHVTKRLGSLVSRLLDTSRLSTGEIALERQPMDLVACTKEVIASLQERAQSKDIEMSLRGAAEAPGNWDPLRLDQVVYNLLENAIRYGGSPIEVAIETGDATVTVDVIDHGPGISASDRARVFSVPFADRRLKPEGGLGLGLYISRAIVESHGGKLTLEDPTSGGTHFRMQLPKEPPP